jgi:hypothetical protein
MISFQFLFFIQPVFVFLPEPWYAPEAENHASTCDNTEQKQWLAEWMQIREYDVQEASRTNQAENEEVDNLKDITSLFFFT